MNILQVQDRLKDLSDQQLAREMANPTGAAPQYLVLTELQRRKKMRDAAQVQQAPQQSMAEEAVHRGIASLQQEPSSYELEEQAEAEGMYAGGVVRMSAGGETRRPLASLSPEEFAAFQRMHSQSQLRAQWPNHPGYRSVPTTLPYTAEELEAEAFRRSNISRPNAPSRFAEDPESDFANRSPDQMNVRAATSAGSITPPENTLSGNRFFVETAPPSEASPSGLDFYGNPLPHPPLPPPSQGAVEQRQARASGAAATNASPAAASGIGSLPQSNAMRDRLMAELEGESTTSRRLDELAQQMGRTDPAARRSEALNMALIEAGLRVAGSQSPHFASAIAEAAPAMQGYSRSLSEIRKDQRDDTLTQIQMERARAEDSRSRRALMANLYGTDTQRDLAIMRERGDAGRHAATMDYNERRLTSEDENRRQQRILEERRLSINPNVQLAEWVNSAPNEAERTRRLEAVGRDPSVREAQLEETRRRNTEVALNNWRQAGNSDFVPNLPRERIEAMRPAQRQRYEAQQAEYDRILRGGGGGAAITPDNPLGIRR